MKHHSLTAGDVMKTSVITAREDETIVELARTLVDNHISGAPVLDKKGALVGVISQTDLVRRERENENEASQVSEFHRSSEDWMGREGFQVAQPDLTRVRDVMTPAVLSADVNAPVEELAKIMTEKGIHRIVITNKGKLAGIVTSMDLLRVIFGDGRRGAKK